MRIALPGSGELFGLTLDREGQRLAIARGAQVWLVDAVQGSPLLGLTSTHGASVEARRIATQGATICVEFLDPARGRDGEGRSFLEAFDLSGRRRHVMEDDLDGLGINGWALSHDGTLLASATEFGQAIGVVELPANGRDPRRRYGHFNLQRDLRGTRFTMAFSPDDTRLCTSVRLKLFDVTDTSASLPMLEVLEKSDPNVDHQQVEGPEPYELLGFDEAGKRIFFLGETWAPHATAACILGRSPLRLARHPFVAPEGQRVAAFDVASRRALWLPAKPSRTITTLDATNGAISSFELPGALAATRITTAAGLMAWSDGAELEVAPLPPK